MMKVDELMSESQMCELLGIKDESAPNTAIPTNDEQRHDNAVGQMLMVLPFHLMMRCQVRW